MGLMQSIREQSGLTQSALAARAGTSRTRLSAYEHEHTDPGLDVVHRVAAAVGLEVTAVPLGTTRIRVRVREIATSVDSGDDAHALRLAAELIDWIRRGIIAVDALDNDPGSTGDRRWDALLGGIAEVVAHEHGRCVPAWASAPGRILPAWWIVTPLRALWSTVIVDTPAPLLTRGVVLSRTALVSV
jgi:transcriptional regulator with XRE-family HTH domain